MQPLGGGSARTSLKGAAGTPHSVGDIRREHFMKKRTSTLLILVLVAVVALVLGSFGTATAGGLTKSQVKKIAKKVVHKEAPSLSVDHAPHHRDNSHERYERHEPQRQAALGVPDRNIPVPAPDAGCVDQQDLQLPWPAERYLPVHLQRHRNGWGLGQLLLRATDRGGHQHRRSGLLGRAPVPAAPAPAAWSRARARRSTFTARGSVAFSMNTANASSSVTFTRIDSLTNGTATAP